jgi:hypothetical protein
MRDNAKRNGKIAVALKCQKRIDILQMEEYKLDADNPRHRELMHWTMEGLRIYEQRRAEEKGLSSYRANYTRKTLKHRGVINALANLATRSGPSLGFNTLSDAKQIQWTAEAGVCKFEDLFEPEVIQKATKRLKSRT